MQLKKYIASLLLTALYSVQFLHAAIPHDNHQETVCHTENGHVERAIGECNDACEENVFDWLSCLFGDVEHSDSNLELDVKEFSGLRFVDIPADLSLNEYLIVEDLSTFSIVRVEEDLIFRHSDYWALRGPPAL